MNPTLRDKLDRVLEGSRASLPRRREWTKNERAEHEVSGLARDGAMSGALPIRLLL